MTGGYGAGPGGTPGYGPGYGPGMMGGGYGPGMMGGGYGDGLRGMMEGWGQVNPNQPTISLGQAQQDVQAYVNQIGNPDLALSEVMEFQNNFYAIVKEKSTGIGAFEVLIDKGTGATSFEPQSVMGNTKYGGMGQSSWMGRGTGYTTATGPMTVSADQARQLGQGWLDQYQPGSTTEATPDTFYGYYTMHTLKNGQITGMLSVNG
jgi:hypothetical protein